MIERCVDICDRSDCGKEGLGTMYFAHSALGELHPVLFVCDKCKETDNSLVRGDEEDSFEPF